MSSTFDKEFIHKVLYYAGSDNAAFCIKGKFYSYKDLWACATAIAGSLKSEESGLIGLYASDDIHTYASILALWMTGKAYVPLNPNQPVARHQEVACSVGMKCILSTDAKYDIGLQGIRLLNTASIEPDYSDPGKSLVPVADTETAYIIFTSGSTGKPKGVPISRGNVAAFINSMNNIGMDITEKDKCLQPFDLTFDFSVSSYLVPLIHGACSYTIPQKAIKYLYIASLIEDEKLSVLQMVPSMMRNLLPYLDELDLSSIRYNIFCGEALLSDDIVKWHRRNPEMTTYNMYGPTEDTVFCSYYLIDKNNQDTILSSNNIVSIGGTFRNSSLLLMDEDGRIIQEPDKNGELCLAGAQLSAGYWDNPDENSRKFFECNGRRYYRSGDICHYAGDGNLMYVSRKDFQVKINGFRVELGEIENTYKEVSGGRYAIVIPFENAQHNTELAIAIEGKEYDWSDDRKAMESRLPKYEIPSKWIFVRSMPLNQNGKVDRKEISEYL